jgi:hypothetical protein
VGPTSDGELAELARYAIPDFEWLSRADLAIYDGDTNTFIILHYDCNNELEVVRVAGTRRGIKYRDLYKNI